MGKLNFIVGTGRCGSSILHEILVLHRDVSFITNVEDNFPILNSVSSYFNALYRVTAGHWTRKGRLRLAPSEGYKILTQNVSPIYANSDRDLAAEDVTPWLRHRFTEFFLKNMKFRNNSVFLHKYTGWSRIGFFSEIFPDSIFVHVVRDGRAVANSWLQMKWWGGYRGTENWLWGNLPQEYFDEWMKNKRSYVVLAGIAWKLLMDSFEEAEKNIDPSRYMRIRYEDLVARPSETIQRVFHILNIPINNNMRSSLAAAEKLRDSRVYAYQKDLNREQLRILNLSLAEKLARYGYQV